MGQRERQVNDQSYFDVTCFREQHLQCASYKGRKKAQTLHEGDVPAPC